MFDGPHAPRVVPISSGSSPAERISPTQPSLNRYHALRRDDAQRSHVSTHTLSGGGGGNCGLSNRLLPPTDADTAGYAIPWSRLYTAATNGETGIAEENGGHVEGGSSGGEAGYDPRRTHPPSAIEVLQRRSSPSAPVSTGASTTMVMNTFRHVPGHAYHNEHPPMSSQAWREGGRRSGSAAGGTSVSAPAVTGDCYRQLAAEHQYGTAQTRAKVNYPASEQLLYARSPYKEEAEDRLVPRNRRRGERRQEEDFRESDDEQNKRNPRGRQRVQQRRYESGQLQVLPQSPRHHNRSPSSSQQSPSASSLTASEATSAPAVALHGGRRSARAAASQRSRSGPAQLQAQTLTSVHDTNRRRLQHRESPRRESPRRRAQSASGGAAVTRRPSHSLPRTAQWAVKLVDDLVAQVAVQQVSAVTAPVIAAASHPKTSRTGASISHSAASTVADLTTSFLSTRFGALQWRPMLREFAVCLHRYQHLSPACAVFREYFIHTEADSLSDFQLFCRLHAAADIAHCSTVEVRRVPMDVAGHTMISRRYVDLREAADRVVKMLQTVVLVDATTCVVVGEVAPASSSARQGAPRAARGSSGGGGVQYRYARGPPAHTGTRARRRRLTDEEIREVRRVVTAWLEESAASASHDQAENSDEEGETRGNAGATLRDVAFDRPGMVDAYALLQATLEATKLVCYTAPRAIAARLTSAEQGEEEEEDTTTISSSSSGSAREDHKRSGRPRQHSPRADTAQPAWTSPTRNAHSPLVRRVMQSPPDAYHYPIDNTKISSSGGAGNQSGNSPLGRQSQGGRGGQLESPRRAEVAMMAVEDERYGLRDQPGPRRARGRQERQRTASPEYYAKTGPSYRQPRASASVVHAHRSPDGRLWSPPRTGELARQQRQQQSASIVTPSPAARASASHSARQLAVIPQQPAHHPVAAPLSPISSPPLHEGKDWDTAAQSYPQHHHHRSQHAPSYRNGLAPATAAVSLPISPPPPMSQPMEGPNDYIQDLRGRQRWERVREEVEATERRESVWRSHPRMLARMQSHSLVIEEEQHQQLNGGQLQQQQRQQRDTVEAIDLELQRRARARSEGMVPAAALHDEVPRRGAALVQLVPEALFLRDAQDDSVSSGLPVTVPATTPSQQPSTAFNMEVFSQQIPRMRSSVSGPLDAADGYFSSPFLHNAVQRIGNSSASLSANYNNPNGSGVHQARSGAVPPPAHVERISSVGSVRPMPSLPQPQRTSSAVIAQVPSAGLRFAADTAAMQRSPPLPPSPPITAASSNANNAHSTSAAKETVYLTVEEQSMLDQLEVALHRLDRQNRREHTAASEAAASVMSATVEK